MKWKITIAHEDINIEVEADNIDEASEKALEKYTEEKESGEYPEHYILNIKSI